MSEFTIQEKKIGINSPTYFIADIAANHDGNINRAIDLIHGINIYHEGLENK